jgi:hypothetical protein
MYRSEGSKDAPSVILDENSNEFVISGPSFSENAIPVYEPVMAWIDTYAASLTTQLNCEFDFYYLNSSSKRSVFSVLKRLEKLYLEGVKISIVWKYERFDDDMLEQGQEYADILNLPFTFVSKD